MKRYATFFLSILLLAALTACGSGSSPSGKDAPPVRTPMGTKDTEQTSDLEQAYSDLVERFRTLVSDPFGQDSDEPGEMGVLETARGWGTTPRMRWAISSRTSAAMVSQSWRWEDFAG